MNQKEELILEEIINYIKENKTMPTHRYLQKKFNYKSVNSVTQYLKSLEKQNYLTRNKIGKLILSKYSFDNNTIKKIKIINAHNSYVQIIIDKNKNYIGYKIHNNSFSNMGIFRNDILIVEIKKKLKANDLGLFIIDNKYRIMKYNYQDGFYLLEDHEKLVLHKVKTIGKVIIVERKL